MEEMNNPINMKLIISKLPFKMKDRWRTIAIEYKRNHRRARFKQLVSFIERHSRIASYPPFGDLQEFTPKKEVKGPITNGQRSKSTPTYRGSSFVTIATNKQNSKSQATTLSQDKPAASNPNPVLFVVKTMALIRAKNWQEGLTTKELKY